MGKIVVFNSPFVPAEWIAAHGLRPCRLLPRGPDDRLGPTRRRGVCCYVQALLDALEGHAGEAVVFTTTCDQMRRSAEWLARSSQRPVFLMNVPATWQSPAAGALYRSELERLGRFLCSLGGQAPAAEDLAAVMRRYDDSRSLLRAAAGRLSGRAYAKALAEFGRTGRLPALAELPPVAAHSGPGVAVVGEALGGADGWVFDVIEAAGGRVVLDATEGGERALARPFDRRRLVEDPLSELADAYFGHIPAVFRRPNTHLYAYLKNELAARSVRALVVWRYVWCDLWHAEVHLLRDWLDIPVLDLDADDAGAPTDRIRTRLQGLMEILQ